MSWRTLIFTAVSHLFFSEDPQITRHTACTYCNFVVSLQQPTISGSTGNKQPASIYSVVWPARLFSKISFFLQHRANGFDLALYYTHTVLLPLFFPFFAAQAGHPFIVSHTQVPIRPCSPLCAITQRDPAPCSRTHYTLHPPKTSAVSIFFIVSSDTKVLERTHTSSSGCHSHEVMCVSVYCDLIQVVYRWI